MKTHRDFEPDTSPLSLKEIIRNEYLGFTQTITDNKGQTHQYPRHIPDLDDLLQKVYSHIEQQALEVYHSNEPWALKQWALNNILKEEVVTEATVQIASELVSPVMDWQGQSYDPVSQFHEKLVADGKPPHSRRQYMVSATKFVARKGRKRNYPREDIIEHFAWLREKGYVKKTRNRKTGEVYFTEAKYTQASLRREYVMLQEFFRFLYGKRDWQLPVARVKVPTADDLNQPMLSHEQVENLIFSTVIDNLPANWIVRLAVATLYGARVSELGNIELHLDGTESSIFIRTSKGGERRRQPIPATLLPLFAVPIKPVSEPRLYYAFRSMADKVNIDLPERAGWHSIRRRVITDVYTKTTAKDLPIAKFFRWQIGGIGQLPTYVQVPMEVSDTEILKQHPFLGAWEAVVPMLMLLHPQYIDCPLAQKLYSHMLKIGV